MQARRVYAGLGLVLSGLLTVPGCGDEGPQPGSAEIVKSTPAAAENAEFEARSAEKQKRFNIDPKDPRASRLGH